MKFRAQFVAGAALCAFAVGLPAPRASADYAVLRNGQRLEISSFERVGESVRLNLMGGSVTVPAEEFVSVEPEEVFQRSARPKLQSPGAGPYAEHIRNAAAAYGLDPLLIESVIAVESNFNPKAVSRKSAQGLMQLLPETAARMDVLNSFDPKQNIEGGAHYLRAMLDRYHQDLVLALAAYNAGPDNVDAYRGVPPFQETRTYIVRVLQRLLRSRQLQARAGTGSKQASSAISR